MRRPSVWLALAVFLALIAMMSGHLYSIDGLSYYRAADRLVQAGSFTFDPPLVWDPGGGQQAPVGPLGFSLALVPGILAAFPLHALQPALTTAAYDQRLLYGDPFYAAVSWINPAIVALTAVIVQRLVVELGGSSRLGIVAGLAAVFSGPLLWYGRADLAQPLSGFLLAAGILVAVRVRHRPGNPGWLMPIVGWAIVTRPVDGVLTAVTIVAITLVRGRHRPPSGSAVRAYAATAAGVVVGLGVSFAVNWLRWGRPFDFGYSSGFDGFWPAGLLAYLVSPGRALVLYLPLTFLAIVGGWLLWRRGRQADLVALALPVGLWVAVYAQWPGLGGWSYGPRFLVPIVPLVVTLAAIAVSLVPGRGVRLAFAALAAAGALVGAGSIAMDQLKVFGRTGSNFWATPGFWRQFDLDAFAPVTSWWDYRPRQIADLADIIWFRLARDSASLSLLAGAIFLGGAVACGLVAWRAAGRIDRRGSVAA